MKQDKAPNRAPLIMIALLPFLFFFQAFPNYRNPNEQSRLLLASAIVDDGTLQIDRALERYG
ncbi:MAG TPA: hypothetical protein VLR94_00665, partial [Acidobacteriota bacterium]|nr:hypothetical protein [Acidobacteriota bacterium]